MKKTSLLLCILLAGLPLPVNATPRSPPPPIKIAVMDVNLQADDIDPIVGESLSSVLAAQIALQGNSRYEVVSRNDLRKLTQHQAEAQLLGCLEPRCLSDLGALAAADQLVTATLGRMDDRLIFTLELIDVNSTTVISRQSVSWQGPQSGVVDLCRPYITRLLGGPKATSLAGDMELIVNEKGAMVHLNDEELGISPVKPVNALPIGKHSLKISKDGFLPFHTDFVINQNETTLFQAQLIDEDTLKPWYAKWWFWTGTAAVVGGAVTAAVLLRDAPATTLEIRTPVPIGLGAP